MKGWGMVLLLALPLADEGDWARVFSRRLPEVEAEVRALEGEAEGLPRVPIDDQGGRGGFASQHSAEWPTDADRHEVEIRWEAPVKIDEVILVPARRYDARGLEPQFGMPDAVEVWALGADGAERRVGGFEGLWGDPVRAGHPLILEAPSETTAVALVIRAGRLFPDPDEGLNYVHAWAECLVMSEGRNVARNGSVKALSGQAPLTPWQWSAGYLVDGQTPLGLPEVKEGDHGNVGWLSKPMKSPDDPVTVDLDLGKLCRMDRIRLYPAKRPTPDLPSGFGFPEQFEVRTAAHRSELAGAEPVRFALPNPGHNPFDGEVVAEGVRYVRLTATRLWKPFDSYPAFCAFSEIEVLDGTTNLAAGLGVRSAEGMENMVGPGGRYWSSQSLTDGFGPEGRLVPMVDWLKRLDRRRELETRQYELRAEGRAIVQRWNRIAVWAVVLASLVGTALLIALPIRFRMREKRKLLEVRERIAGDLHDEVGSNLGSIQMFADLAEGRLGASDELKRIQRIAAETVSAVRDIVWLLRPGGGHRIGTVEHLRETASIMLERLDWHFSADDPSWELELNDEQNRHLFLFFREALHNILRHAAASAVWISVKAEEGRVSLEIRDDGVGIPVEKRERPSTLRALRQRAESLRGEFIFVCGETRGLTLRVSFPAEI
ncbi:signal transduction histidine kinase [Haloferula luteola]|uniref:Signal transduction histidine kinase n=1 Tax=Haloferula luteola TaxID=595692 RepID=A0A840V7B9_9BACT|nr:histidine kinase [Haloferula luteola]MBB5350638.1 signal transduction histidine kinase [Haloferula luteola]